MIVAKATWLAGGRVDRNDPLVCLVSCSQCLVVGKNALRGIQQTNCRKTIPNLDVEKGRRWTNRSTEPFCHRFESRRLRCFQLFIFLCNIYTYSSELPVLHGRKIYILGIVRSGSEVNHQESQPAPYYPNRRIGAREHQR